ncbi:hypothetical protein AB0C07_30935 [Actinoplanes missouriensis]|uniref:hypothetical protein n=1 Tax=Actinoplanes missouriensis TaxID=1866 RepID=UPI0033C6EDEF
MTALSEPGVPAHRHLIALPRGRPVHVPVRAPESARRHLIAIPRARQPEYWPEFPPGPPGPAGPAGADRRPAIAVALSVVLLALLCGGALTAVRLILGS